MKKKIVVLMALMMMLVGAFAVPRLEGNKIYLDEAATSLFTAEQFIENIGGEDKLDIPDRFGNTKRMQLELFCNPNKVIEFATEEDAAELYNLIMTTDIQPNDLYVSALDHYENLDFWLFLMLSKECTTPGCTPTYCYVEAW